MSGHLRKMISYYVSSISNAYLDAMPDRLDGGDEATSIASGMVDDGTMRRIQLQCWRVLDQNKTIILSHLHRAGLSPQDCPSAPVSPRAVYDDRPYTDKELESLVSAERYATVIFDAIMSVEQDVTKSPAALASIIATGVLYKQIAYYRWPFELLFLPRLHTSFFPIEHGFWLAAFQVMSASNRTVKGQLRDAGAFDGGELDFPYEFDYSIPHERRNSDAVQLLHFFFVAVGKLSRDIADDRHKLLRRIVAGFIKQKTNLPLIWQAIIEHQPGNAWLFQGGNIA